MRSLSPAARSLGEKVQERQRCWRDPSPCPQGTVHICAAPSCGFIEIPPIERLVKKRFHQKRDGAQPGKTWPGNLAPMVSPRGRAGLATGTTLSPLGAGWPHVPMPLGLCPCLQQQEILQEMSLSILTAYLFPFLCKKSLSFDKAGLEWKRWSAPRSRGH